VDKELLTWIGNAVTQKDFASLAGQAVVELNRIANAQEAIVALAQADLDEQIEEAVKSRAEALAEEMDAKKTKRSFIGKKTT